MTRAELHANYITDAKVEIMDIYEALASSDWTSDDCDPEDLTDAVNTLRELVGAHAIDDYAEAVDWASFLVSQRDLGTYEGTPIDPVAMTAHESNRDRATFRGDQG